MNKPKIVHQDRDLLVFLKPSGWHTYGDSPNVKEEHESKSGSKIFPVHRLDRDTEGLLVFARNQRAAAALSQSFQRKKVDKTYFAAVWGKPPGEKGSIRTPLKKKSSEPAEPAWTDYRVMKTLRRGEIEVSLLEVSPRTGKFHQIRKHLRSIDCPILGDPLYLPSPKKDASEKAFGSLPLCLCADRLSFPHPVTGKTVKLSIQPSFERAFNKT